MVEKEQRDMIAEAVHLTILETSSRGGRGECQRCAILGAALINRVCPGLKANGVIGSLYLQSDLGDPTLWFAQVATPRNMALDGEFHAWIAAHGNGRDYLIDLSARWYRDLVEGAVMPTADGDVPRWRRPSVPYLWGESGSLPSWVQLRENSLLTHHGISEVRRIHAEAYERDESAVFDHYNRLAAEAEQAHETAALTSAQRRKAARLKRQAKERNRR